MESWLNKYGLRNTSINHFHSPVEANTLLIKLFNCFRYSIIVAHFSLAGDTNAVL